MTLILIVLSLIYYVLIGLVIHALIAEKGCSGADNLPTAAVIVCARNEEQNIQGLTSALKKLDYPKDCLEIFLVDDASEDGTGEYIDDAAMEDSRIRALHITEKPDGLMGKKNAITTAVGMAKSDIILLTDADCRPGPGWVRRMAACFGENTGMVMGFSPVKAGRGFFHRFTEFDQLARVAVQAAGAYWNIPPFSCARNLAFSRKVFFEVNGYESSGTIATGDDFFLTRDIWLKTHREFRHAVHPESFVTTAPDRLSGKYIRQQMRRNGKLIHLAPLYRVLGIAVLAYFLFFPLTVFFVPPLFWIISLALKTIIEWMGIAIAGRRFGNRRMARWFPVMAVYYPLHILISSMAGSAARARWK